MFPTSCEIDGGTQTQSAQNRRMRDKKPGRFRTVFSDGFENFSAANEVDRGRDPIPDRRRSLPARRPLGAFGAHALKAKLESNGMLDVWNKACCIIFYTPSLSSPSRSMAREIGSPIFYCSVASFSSAQSVCAGADRSPAGSAQSPIGGLCFLAGWAWLIISPPR